MFSEFPWVKYAPSIKVELQQCLDEGRDVEKYREEAERIFKMDGAEEGNIADLGVVEKAEFAVSNYKEALAIALGDKMKSEPIRADYPYKEPSTKEEIFALCDSNGEKMPVNLTDEEIYDKIKGAWTGRISGCMLGKPVEGCPHDKFINFIKNHNMYPLRRYMTLEEALKDYKDGELPWNPQRQRAWIDTIKGASLPDDDTDYTILALKLLETRGRDFTADQVLFNWVASVPFTAVCTAERVAYRNACQGIEVPQTATYLNPFREWIGAQIRADFYGYINPGDTRTAADMAFRDASISHTGNGIYGSMFIAAMTAAAFVIDEPRELVLKGLSEIPATSRLHEDVMNVVKMYDEGKTFEEIMKVVTDKYPHSMWVHTNPNAMIVAAALLFGEKDYAKTTGLSVEGGYDTDCNGATAGSLVGTMIGFKNIPPVWYEKNNNSVNNRIIGFVGIVTADDLATRTMPHVAK